MIWDHLFESDDDSEYDSEFEGKDWCEPEDGDDSDESDGSMDVEMPIAPAPRVEIGHPPRKNPFTDFTEEEFLMLFRLNKSTVTTLLEDIKDNIEFETERIYTVPPVLKLLLTLRYYATAASCSVIANFAGVGVRMTENCIQKVTDIIARKCHSVVTFPHGENRKRLIEKFRRIANFPNVIGALGSTHIKFEPTGETFEERYKNRMGYFSLKVQVVADPDLCFTHIIARHYGSATDHDIFYFSNFRHWFEEGLMGDCVLLAGQGNRVKSYLLTPLQKPETPAEVLYNAAHMKTRVVVDKSFHLLKTRFPVLSVGMKLPFHHVQAVAVAAMVLHNIATRDQVPMPPKDPGLAENSLGGAKKRAKVSRNARRREDLIVNYFEKM